MDHVVTTENLTLPAKDGYQLAATLYSAAQPRGRLIVAAATGVPQGFYRRFAEYARDRGFTTLTFDYRGIGRSAPPTLRGFDMQYLDWAYLDLAAVVDHMADENLPLYMVGHSFGGHAFGLLPNHHQVSGFYTFGTGAGWHGWMPKLEQIKVLAMWRVIAPVLVRQKGCLAWSRLGMGEDLPMGVYRQWKRWCSFPRYFFEDPQMAGVEKSFARVTTPIVAVNALDDLWAPPASRDAFMSAYSRAPYQPVTLDSVARGLGSIGHMGYFRQSASPLWDETLDWFTGLPQGSSAPASGAA
jgi:predicted alpha/beta hydrolase